MTQQPARLTGKPILGLVGGVGCGKSTVAELLRQLGGGVVAGDPVGHDALKQPDIKQCVLDRWGSDLLNAQGQIDRVKLGAIVFANSQERRQLEQLVFPWIRERLRERMAQVDADAAVQFIVLDAAVMLEAGWDSVCDRILFIDVPEATRKARVAQQRGWSAEEVRNREAAQWSLERKRKLADAVVHNDGTLEQTKAQLVAIIQGFQQTGWRKD